MLKIEVKAGESIERALKRYKRKYRKFYRKNLMTFNLVIQNLSSPREEMEIRNNTDSAHFLLKV